MEDFDIYPPNVTQNINRKDGKVYGNKNFDYYVIPNEPGVYRLDDLFNWVYFSPRKERYDTLKSKYMVRVEGESLANENIQAVMASRAISLAAKLEADEISANVEEISSDEL